MKSEIEEDDNVSGKYRPGLISTTDLATLVGTTPATISVWRHQGKITPYICIGKVVRFELESVLKELGITSTK
jgi:predicted site-specific integrase-resolvase